MSSENIGIARRSIQAFHAGDYSEALAPFDEEIEYDLRHFPEGQIYRGHEGVREAFRIWMGAFDDYRQEVGEIIDAGDDEVIVLVTEFGRGKGSGIETERSTAGVWTFRDGKVVRIRFYDTRDAALDALGLSK